MHQVQSRGGDGSCNPVLCFTCNLIFIEIHFLLRTWNRIKRKRVKMSSSSGQSCQYLTWSARCESPERDQFIFLYVCNKKHFFCDLYFLKQTFLVCRLNRANQKTPDMLAWVWYVSTWPAGGGGGSETWAAEKKAENSWVIFIWSRETDESTKA